MDLNWFQSILYGFISGLTDILPVSSQAHKVLLLKLYGIKGVDTALLDMLGHAAIFAGLYFMNRSQLVRFSRARALARVPKRRRKRPLDTRSLMDLSMLKTMAVPVVLGILLYRKVLPLQSNLTIFAVFLLINGIILYVPQFFPSSNRDARTLSPVEGLAVGLGGGISILPGISAIGAATSIGSICGVERSYGLNMALLMNMGLMLGYFVYDCMAVAAVGFGAITFALLAQYLATAAAAFVGTVLAVKFLRYLVQNHGFSVFGLYSIGLALFTFILNLMA